MTNINPVAEGLTPLQEAFLEMLHERGTMDRIIDHARATIQQDCRHPLTEPWFWHGVDTDADVVDVPLRRIKGRFCIFCLRKDPHGDGRWSVEGTK